MHRSLLGVADLADHEVEEILDLAGEFAAGGGPEGRRPLVGLSFLSSSLRTRGGFTAATARLGGAVVDASNPRWSPGMSGEESFRDMLRTLTGMTDVVVLRTPFLIERDVVATEARCPVINGGELGGEHPTQALIDLAALRAEVKSPADAHIMLCGDLTARSVRSLVRLLERFPPARLSLISPPGRSLDVELGTTLAKRVTMGDSLHPAGVDVLYLAGLPEGLGDDRLDANRRRQYALTPEVLDDLPKVAAVLSPLPVVDEVDPSTRSDPRVKMFEQSDRGVFVRMAVLHWVQERAYG